MSRCFFALPLTTKIICLLLVIFLLPSCLWSCKKGEELVLSDISSGSDTLSGTLLESSAESFSENTPSTDKTDSSLSEKENVCIENKTRNMAPEASLPSDIELLTDGDTSTSVTLYTGEAGNTVTLEWDEPLAIDRVLCRESGNAVDHIEIRAIGPEGELLKSYTQEACGAMRVSAMAQHNVKKLEFVFDSSDADYVTISEIEVYSLKKTAFHIFESSAYLPVNSAFSSESLSEGLKALDDIVLISGVYWDENGKIAVTDGFKTNYTQLLAQIEKKALSLRLRATVYPAYRMTNSGTAGNTIDTPEKRKILIDELIEFAASYHLCGIDFDWEFPKDEREWELFSLLLTELKETADRQLEESLSLSAAFYPGKGALSQEAFAALDRVHVMTYDQFDENGYHSTYHTSCLSYDSVQYFADRGCDRAKIHLGIPCYGRPFDASQVWNLYSDAAIPDAYTNVWKGSYYNSQALAADKAAFAYQEGLGGVFLYHMKCDKPFDDPLSLLRGIKEYLSFNPDVD